LWLALPLTRAFQLAGLCSRLWLRAHLFPNLIHITPRRFGKASSQAVIGLQMAAAYVGSTLMPPIVGWVGQKAGFALLPYYLVACLLALSIGISVCNRKTGFETRA
jgi:fucose permease